jgi:hypothetical protein
MDRVVYNYLNKKYEDDSISISDILDFIKYNFICDKESENSRKQLEQFRAMQQKKLDERNSSNSEGFNYINYQTIREGTKELIRNNIWDFEFITPDMKLFPNRHLFKVRITDIKVEFPIENGSGTITLNFIDREDQTISKFIYDWRNKYSKLKDVGCILTLFNEKRKPIRIYTLHDLQPMGMIDLNLGGEPKTQTITCPLKFGHYHVQWCNID